MSDPNDSYIARVGCKRSPLHEWPINSWQSGRNGDACELDVIDTDAAEEIQRLLSGSALTKDCTSSYLGSGMYIPLQYRPLPVTVGKRLSLFLILE